MTEYIVLAYLEAQEGQKVFVSLVSLLLTVIIFPPLNNSRRYCDGGERGTMPGVSRCPLLCGFIFFSVSVAALQGQPWAPHVLYRSRERDPLLPPDFSL